MPVVASVRRSRFIPLQALQAIRGKTIVPPGALAPARFKETDAPFNLGMVFTAVQVAPPGVDVAMNGTVFRGDHGM